MDIQDWGLRVRGGGDELCKGFVGFVVASLSLFSQSVVSQFSKTAPLMPPLYKDWSTASVNTDWSTTAIYTDRSTNAHIKRLVYCRCI